MNIKTKAYRIYAKQICHISNDILTENSITLGFPPSFMQNWRNIVGDISSVVYPVKLSINSKKNEYILHINIIDLSFWSNWKMIDRVVKIKLESFLNKPCEIKVKKAI